MTTEKIICITGATGGLGKALSLELAAPGVHFILISRRKRLLEKVDDLIQVKGATATLVPTDLREPQLLDQLAAPILERFGHIDFLFSCAAVSGPMTPAAQINPQDWQKVMNVNLTSNYYLLRALSPLLERADKSHAVFMDCELLGAYDAAYAASKAGLRALIERFCKESTKTSLKAHIMDPGPMATALYKKAFPGRDIEAVPTPENAARTLLDKLI